MITAIALPEAPATATPTAAVLAVPTTIAAALPTATAWAFAASISASSSNAADGINGIDLGIYLM